MPEQFVRVPQSQMFQLFKDISELKKVSIVADLIPEDEAARVLQLKNKRSLQCMVSNKKISPDCYTVLPNKKRLYFKSKLIGL